MKEALVVTSGSVGWTLEAAWGRTYIGGSSVGVGSGSSRGAARVQVARQGGRDVEDRVTGRRRKRRRKSADDEGSA